MLDRNSIYYFAMDMIHIHMTSYYFWSILSAMFVAPQSVDVCTIYLNLIRLQVFKGYDTKSCQCNLTSLLYIIVFQFKVAQNQQHRILLAYKISFESLCLTVQYVNVSYEKHVLNFFFSIHMTVNYIFLKNKYRST